MSPVGHGGMDTLGLPSSHGWIWVRQSTWETANATQMITGLLFSLYLKGKDSRVRDNRAAHRGHRHNSTSRNTTRFLQTIYMI